LTKNFGGLRAVDNLSFAVKEAEIVGIIGPNGAGKTVTFNLITGIYKPDAGSIVFEGNVLNGLKPHQICNLGVGRTFQITRIFPELTVLENLKVAERDEKAYNRAIELLPLLGIDHLKNEYAANMSYGQRRLLEFVRLLTVDPQLILLDEPFSGINPRLCNEISDLVAKLRKDRKTFLVIEHNMKLLMSLADRIVALDKGKKIAEGKPREIQQNEEVIESYFGG